MLFYYVRHADPIYSPDGLTPFGFEQAELLANKFRDIKLDAVYSSSSNRAVLTSAPTAKAQGLTTVTMDWAHEGVIGQSFFLHDPKWPDLYSWCFNLPTFVEIFRSPETAALGDAWFDHPALANTPLKQGTLKFWAAMDSFFADLGFEHDRSTHTYRVTRRADRADTRNVAFFAHGGCGMCFMSSLLDIPYPFFSTHFSEHMTTGITVVRMAENTDVITPKVMVFNETPHLFAAGVHNQFNV